jgi:predicted nucleotidyltransferase
MIIVIIYNKNMFNFKSQITIKTLGYFFVNPDKKHYINELAGILAVDPGNLFRKLKELEAEGILQSEVKGNQKYYWLNKKYPLFNELKKSFELKHGFTAILKDKLIKLKDLQTAYIFGSFANNQTDNFSDIDLLLIGEPNQEKLDSLLKTMERQYDREINYNLYSFAEYERKRSKDGFLKEVLKNKLIKIV